MVDDNASAIMIVGVDSNFTYLMQYYANKSGRRAFVSYPDQEVLTLAQRELPAVILLETDRAEGLVADLLQHLKANQPTCQIPIVACSWLDEAPMGLAEQLAGYMQKPILYDDFLTALADVGCACDQNGRVIE